MRSNSFKVNTINLTIASISILIFSPLQAYSHGKTLRLRNHGGYMLPAKDYPNTRRFKDDVWEKLDFLDSVTTDIAEPQECLGTIFKGKYHVKISTKCEDAYKATMNKILASEDIQTIGEACLNARRNYHLYIEHFTVDSSWTGYSTKKFLKRLQSINLPPSIGTEDLSKAFELSNAFLNCFSPKYAYGILSRIDVSELDQTQRSIVFRKMLEALYLGQSITSEIKHMSASSTVMILNKLSSAEEKDLDEIYYYSRPRHCFSAYLACAPSDAPAKFKAIEIMISSKILIGDHTGAAKLIKSIDRESIHTDSRYFKIVYKLIKSMRKESSHESLHEALSLINYLIDSTTIIQSPPHYEELLWRKLNILTLLDENTREVELLLNSM